MKNMIEKPCNKEALKAAKVLKNYCASHACNEECLFYELFKTYYDDFCFCVIPEDWIIGEEEEVL